MVNPIKFATFPAVAIAIADFIFSLALPVAIIMILYGGFLYMTAGGSEDKIKKAHQALLWALIGLAIVLAGKGLVRVICSALKVTTCGF